MISRLFLIDLFRNCVLLSLLSGITNTIVPRGRDMLQFEGYRGTSWGFPANICCKQNR